MIDHSHLTFDNDGFCKFARSAINWHYQHKPDLVKAYIYAKRTGGFANLTLSNWIEIASAGRPVRWTTVRKRKVYKYKTLAEYKALPVKRVLEQRHKKDFEMPILVQYHSKNYTIINNGIYLTVATEVYNRNPLVWVVRNLDWTNRHLIK